MRRPARARAGGALAACVALACLLAACAPAPSRGALLAVDYGSEWLKVALVAPGRAPISIVMNEASQRKSLAAVSFSGGERALGDEAAALAGRYPERVFLKPREFLGVPASGKRLAAQLRAAYSAHAPGGAGARGTVALRAHGFADESEALFTAEELAGSVLHYARACAEAQAGSPIRDAVVTVPPYWSQAQRSALADAAALAGLNLLSLVSEPAAAATQYGIDREPPANNGTELVVIVDVGAGSASAALVAYSGWRVREAGKTKTYNQFEIKAMAWDEGAGGAALDALLAGALRSARAKRTTLPQGSGRRGGAAARSARPGALRRVPTRSSGLCPRACARARQIRARAAPQRRAARLTPQNPDTH